MTTTPKRRRGYPALQPGAGEAPRVMARLPRALYDRLQAQAEVEGVKPSVITRRALERELQP